MAEYYAGEEEGYEDTLTPGYYAGPVPSFAYGQWEQLSPEEQEALQRQMASAPASIPVPPEGLNQYFGPTGQDIERGQYASSFIAPNIDPFGRTISGPGFDDRERNEEEAMRTRGWHEYNQLIDGGATQEEAYRRTAHLINWKHPNALAAGISRIPGSDTPFTPVMERVEGGRVLRTSPRGAHFIRDTVPTMPQHIRDQRKLLESEIRSIEGNQFGLKDPGNQRLPELKRQYMELGTNWMQKPSASAAAPPPIEGPIAPSSIPTVTSREEYDRLPKGAEYIGKNGKRFRKP